jgi:hypothetical protein
MDHEEQTRGPKANASSTDVNSNFDIALQEQPKPTEDEERNLRLENEVDRVTGAGSAAPATANNADAPIFRTTAQKDKEIFSSEIVWICSFTLLLYVVSL